MNEYEELLLNSIIPSNASDEDKQITYKNISEAKNKLQPKSLYRYRSFSEQSLSALLDDKIYFSRPIDFNDPYDCLSQVSENIISDVIDQEFNIQTLMDGFNSVKDGAITEEYFNDPNFENVVKLGIETIMKADKSDIDEFFSKLKDNPAVLEKLKMQIMLIYQESHLLNLKSSREDVGIACFSENVYSILMWSHYADYHKGFCIEYDFEELDNLQLRCFNCNKKCEVERILELYPVIYSEVRYGATNYEMEMLKHRLQFEVTQEVAPLYIPDILHFVKSNTLKSNDWSYEKEWRLIFSCRSNKNFDKFEILRPKAIYLGSKMSKSNKEIILRLIEGKGMKVFEMFVDEANSNYSLKIKEMD